MGEFGAPAGLKTALCYGGEQNSKEQFAEASEAIHTLVATTGRLWDWVENKNYDLSEVKVLVLDEADRMLDDGFEWDVRAISDKCHDDRQTLMFSATFPDAVRELSEKFLTDRN